MIGTILIVDDEQEICAVVSEYLEQKGYAVFEANDVPQARRHLKNGLHPDLVILDVVLQGVNGMAFLREIRSSVAPREVPVIMISAYHTTPDDRVSGLETGADDYLSKPFDLRELLLRIERLMKSRPRSTPLDFIGAGNVEPGADPQHSMTSVLKGILKNKPGGPELPPLPPAPDKSSTPVVPSVSARPEPVAAIPDFTSVPEVETHAFSLRDIASLFVRVALQPLTYLSRLGTAELRVLSHCTILAAALVAGAQAGIEAKSASNGVISALIISVAYYAATALVAAGVQWVLGLRKKPVKFKEIFITLGIAFIPLVIAGFLGAIYVAAGGRAGDFTASPLLLLPSQGSSKYAGYLLRHTDLFEMWAFWLASVALHFKVGGKFRTACWIAFACWAVSVLTGSFMHGFFS